MGRRCKKKQRPKLRDRGGHELRKNKVVGGRLQWETMSKKTKYDRGRLHGETMSEKTKSNRGRLHRETMSKKLKSCKADVTKKTKSQLRDRTGHELRKN